MKRRYYLLYQKNHVYKVLVFLVTTLKSDSQVQKEKNYLLQFASMEAAKSCLRAHVLGVLACLAFLSSYLFFFA